MKKVLENTKYDYQASFYDGKLSDNLTNLGGKKGQKFWIPRSGEYHGLTIELQEDCPPLLTDRLILKICNSIEEDNYLSYLMLLKIDNLKDLKAIISKWFDLNDLKSPYDNVKIKYNILTKHDPITVPIKIVSVGQNIKMGNPVVPEEWLHRVFESGRELHDEMNKLSWRIGKPPVTYCATYSMNILKDPVIEYDKIKTIFLIRNSLKIEKLIKPLENCKQVYYPPILIQYEDKIFINKIIDKTENSGYLSSLLQKCVRNQATAVIKKTIRKLNTAPIYQLPEMQFTTVNPTKQIVWRLFISALEDCRPGFTENLSMLHLILFTLILNRESNLSFSEEILNKIIDFAQRICSTKDLFPWRKNKRMIPTKLVNNDYLDSIYLAHQYLPMMGGDKIMLECYYNDIDLKIYSTIKKSDFNPSLRAMDHHCKPAIILYYQGCTNKKLTTLQISSLIWEKNSKQNLRKDKNCELKELKEIQNILVNESNLLISKRKEINIKTEGKWEIPITDKIRRTIFLILFGKKFNNMMITADGLKIKKGLWIKSNNKSALNCFPQHEIQLSQINPPIGFKWIKNKITVKYDDGYYVKLDDWEKIKITNVEKLLEPIEKPKTKDCNDELVLRILEGKGFSFDELVNYESPKYPINLEILEKVPLVILKLMMVKLAYGNKIECGPVDRSGKKTYNSINPIYEGKVWAVFFILSKLFPSLITSNNLVFTIHNEPILKTYLMRSIQSAIKNHFRKKQIPTKIKIKTELWEHQKQAVLQMIDRYEQGYHGLGNASDVGSGKSLMALAVMTQLKCKGNGFLVLIPQKEIIKTWEDEIKKHTKGFKLIIYDGKPITIDNITIVLSTLGKMRDKPLDNYWKLVVIDECLSVQNREALQTEEAWKQSLTSSHLMMLSATFFRARFDKLYYMLKMLQSGIPENKIYLDTILNEVILRQVSATPRKWKEEIHKFKLSDREEYEKILEKDINDEKKYSMLHSYLTGISVVKHLKKIISDKDNCLIYACSSEEAEEWSRKLGISLDDGTASSKHVITTWAKGTYGLNHLVKYDTIITRPPPPDKLPQMKGRLDRPGQTKDVLKIIYFLWENTIEEAALIRLNVANQFLKDHLMPLSQFYKLALEQSE